jgi:hypothetical protein
MDDAEQGLNQRQLGGLSITLGNAALFANGLIARMYGDSTEVRKAGVGRMASGLGYMGVGAIFMRYGNPSVKRQLKTLEGKLAAHLEKNGVPLDPHEMQKADHQTQKSWFGKIEDFAYDHPIECANVYNLLSASGMLASGIYRWRRGEYTSAKANLACFGLIAAGTAISVLPKELTPEQVTAKGQEGTLWGSVQKQPLNYAVWPFLAADLSYGAQMLGEHKVAKNLPQSNAFKPWATAMAGISAFVTAAYVGGDLLTGFTSKKVTGKPDQREKAREELIDFSAKILAAQPPETQRALVHEATDYLSRQQGLRMVDVDKNQLADRILAATGKYSSGRSL